VLLVWGHPVEAQYLKLAVDPGGRFVAVSAGLEAMTNLRFVPDDPGRSAYHLEIDPFPGWE